MLSVRHALSDLFAGYAIPAQEASAILRDSVDDLIRHCHRTEQPRQLFLQALERRCVAYTQAREAEERDDEDRAPDG